MSFSASNLFEHARLCLALMTAHGVAKLIRLLGKGTATTLPGRLALRLQPRLLPMLMRLPKHASAPAPAPPFNEPTLLVTGTNGKTTTASLLATLLQPKYPRVLHNQLGANMLTGIATCYALATSGWQPRKNHDASVIECDEAYVRHVMHGANFNGMLVTNLFRDQLDRYGELDTTARFISEGIPYLQGSLVLNADDPLVTQLKQHHHGETLFFGLGLSCATAYPSEHHAVPFPQELSICPTCSEPLVYTQRSLSHLGHYRCPHGHFERPTPQVEALILEQTPLQSRLLITALSFVPQPFELTVPLSGVYNIYNVVGAVAMALKLGIQPHQLQQALLRYHPTFGRAERLFVQGKPVTVLLIKNPAGATEVIRLVANDPKARLCVLLNDNDADGRDVSWIWDTAFEDLLQHETLAHKPLFVGGKRCHDMANRLRYAGIPAEQLVAESHTKPLLQQALTSVAEDETLYVLPTYTVLLELRTLWSSFS